MNKPVVFADRHHDSLYESLSLLFEKRLGGTLLTPMGLEWFPEWWKIAEPYGNDPRTANQYLGIRGSHTKDNGILTFENMKGITFEAFKNTPIDIIIASIPAHLPIYKKLILTYHPEAKLVFQMGNMFGEIINNLHDVPNLMSSTIDIPVPGNCNAVFYHQEFPVEVFTPTSINPGKNITSFIHCLISTGHGPTFYQMEGEMPDYVFKSYGASCKDGPVDGIEKMAPIMANSRFGFHCKWGGDGFGHVLYNWYASGRPVIISGHDYIDKLGSELLEDGETCIDIDKHTLGEVENIIRDYEKGYKYEYICQQAYNRFKSCVDFADEEVKLRKFIERLK